jgi:hypothetical protein
MIEAKRKGYPPPRNDANDPLEIRRVDRPPVPTPTPSPLPVLALPSCTSLERRYPFATMPPYEQRGDDYARIMRIDVTGSD